MFVSGGKNAPKNPTLEARVTVRKTKMSKAKMVSSFIEVINKPSASKGCNHKKTSSPPPVNKKGGDDQAVDASKKRRSSLPLLLKLLLGSPYSEIAKVTPFLLAIWHSRTMFW